MPHTRADAVAQTLQGVTLAGGATGVTSAAAFKTGLAQFLVENGDVIATLCGVGGIILMVVSYLTNLVYVKRRDSRAKKAEERADELHKIKLAEAKIKLKLTEQESEKNSSEHK